MSDPVLHIKDSYFFEVPKVLAPATFTSRTQFPPVWVSLDPDFQEWEFKRLYEALSRQPELRLPREEDLHHQWQEWVHADHANFARPFDEFLEAKFQDQLTRFHAWRAGLVAASKTAAQRESAQRKDFEQFLASHAYEEREFVPWSHWRGNPAYRATWAAIRHEAGNVQAYKEDKNVAEWSPEKIAAYNVHLSGKIIIPQPFGELRNLHEAQSTLINPTDRWATGGVINRDDFGFCISKFMVIEVAVGIVVWVLFSWLAARLARGGAPHGKLWNLLETFVVFIRDEIARPALGGHHEEGHGDESHHKPNVHANHGHAAHDHSGQGHSGPGHAKHGHAAPVHAACAAEHDDPVARYTPVLCTIFFFILGCNLAGLLPWIGSPTGTWAVTLAMAIITLLAVTVSGMRQFGFFGFFLNQIPSMDLPWYMALFLKPILFLIEMLGFAIKHGVLSVRLLANMLAGHMVLLAIMSMAFGLEAALLFMQPDGTVSFTWWIAAICAVVGCTLLSLLELFVAFLQAYVFTLLSALFIGAAIHKH